MTASLAGLSSQTDEQLIATYYETGCEGAYEVLFNRHYKSLLSFVYNRFVRDHSAAEDIVQHTFMVVHTDRTYQGGRPFAKWLFSVAGYWAMRQTVLKRRLKSGGGKTIFSLNGKYIHQDSSRTSDDELVGEVNNDIAEVPEDLGVFHIGGGDMIYFKPESVYQAAQRLKSDEARTVINKIYYEKVSERDLAVEMGISRHQIREIKMQAFDEMLNFLMSSPLAA